MRRAICGVLGFAAITIIARAAAATDTITLPSANLACGDIDTSKRFYRAAHEGSGDDRTFNALLLTAITEWDCRLFERGDIVYIENTSWPLVKFHRKGEIKSYWGSAISMKLPEP
jgi:hypothetical protein